mgnify:CR=1 FL=1
MTETPAPGKLYVVGLGPGGVEHLTPAARAALEASDAIAGYKTYLELIPAELLEQKRLLSSGMRQEVDRCRLALDEVRAGQTVALVSSGDSGIYGMAGLVLEMVADDPLEVEVVPGISAVQAAAARLGAPLMHDFAVISLSDLLTPWEKIVARLEAAAQADFVVALYNPRSKSRTTQIVSARQILLQQRSPETPVGIVRQATRPEESIVVTTLGELLEHPIDMFSVVLIGNSATRIDGRGRMVTPRGYASRYDLQQGQVRSSSDTDEAPATAAHALFIGGTGSDVGKSVLAAGLCRILKRRGVSVAPFKAQNMALNSAVTPQGGEIGRAQALQAAACGLAPHTDMNPVLLKPNSASGSQVIVHGRVLGNMSVAEYHAYKTQAFGEVEAAYRRLAAQHQVVVMEGAGSIAEINLMQHDITNLRAAQMAEAPVVLVADIDRGGVFASIVGTFELLPRAQREQICGVIINRFRGDAALLAPGIEAIETRTGVPVLGVVPWLKMQLPEEDSVALARKPQSTSGGGLSLAVIRLPQLSNYSDFDPFEREPGVELAYLEQPQDLRDYDLVLLPGSKTTLADLAWLKESGWAQQLQDYVACGGSLVGICGGYQMLGARLLDPHGVESELREAEGLGLLAIDSELQGDKQTHQVNYWAGDAAHRAGLKGDGQGYEIHMGETRRHAGALPLLELTRADGTRIEDGACSTEGRVWGCYVHGLFDDPALRTSLLNTLRIEKGLASLPVQQQSLELELERLADHLEQHLDLGRLLRRLGV